MQFPSLTLLPSNGIDIIINENKYFDKFLNIPQRNFLIIKKLCDNTTPDYNNYIQQKVTIKLATKYKNLVTRIENDDTKPIFIDQLFNIEYI